jgi:E3 ubiquitin-protein ligase SHPRH
MLPGCVCSIQSLRGSAIFTPGAPDSSHIDIDSKIGDVADCTPAETRHFVRSNIGSSFISDWRDLEQAGVATLYAECERSSDSSSFLVRPYSKYSYSDNTQTDSSKWWNRQVNARVSRVWWYFLTPHSCDGRESLNISELYAEMSMQRLLKVSEIHANTHTESFEVQGLLTQLRPYQEDGVRWMLGLESQTGGVSSASFSLPIDPSVELVRAISSQDPHLETVAAIILRTTQLLWELPCPFVSQLSCHPAGGILADEMGLGKSLEMLCLIAAHQPAQLNPESREVIAGNTLLLCPSNLLDQWQDEISKHFERGSFSVVIYRGISWCESMGWTQEDVDTTCRQQLSGATVVLASFEDLQKEFYHLAGQVKRDHLRTFKRAKESENNGDGTENEAAGDRWNPLVSPLSTMQWHRLVVDEAQKVEGLSTRLAQLCSHISARYRWAVTGTPMPRNFHDILGLLLFVRVHPLDEHLWRRYFVEPYARGSPGALHALLKLVVWRTSKEDVLQELELPPQIEHVLRIRLRPEERHFYMRQEQVMMQWMAERSRSHDDSFAHLTSLRAACCHPQVGVHRLSSFLPTGTPMGLGELRTIMCDKTRIECEEDLRSVLASRNGLAGLALLEGEKEAQPAKEALALGYRLYKENLEVVEKQVLGIRADNLPLYHMHHNLHWVLERVLALNDATILEAAPATLESDSKLHLATAEELRSKYLIDSQVRVDVAERKFAEIGSNVEIEFFAEHSDMTNAWWITILNDLRSSHRHDVFIDQCRNLLLQEGNAVAMNIESSLAFSFQDFDGLKFAIFQELGRIAEEREKVLDVMEVLRELPTSPEAVLAAVMCKRCNPGLDGPICRHCEGETVLEAYEELLFSTMVKKKRKRQPSAFDSDDEHAGTRNAQHQLSELEKLLLFFARSHATDNKTVSEGKRRHMHAFDMLKREFAAIRELWRVQRDFLSAIDEINMAAGRMILLEGEEKIRDSLARPSLYVYREEIAARKQELQVELNLAEAALRQRQVQLRYLTSLAGPCAEDGSRQICAICLGEVEDDFAILNCGHQFCSPCILELHRKTTKSVISCPSCRATMRIAEVGFVSNEASKSVTDDSNAASSLPYQHIALQGSYSSKIDAIVRTIVGIHQEDSSQKILVFSSWLDVLHIIGAALSSNDVGSVLYASDRQKLRKLLRGFREDSNVSVFLLPFSKGSNGLTLVEANHVFLVEPLLSSGVEQQACARVHRIGQTRATHIWKFIVLESVEERILQYMALKRESAGPKTMKEVISQDDIRQLLSGVTVKEEA